MPDDDDLDVPEFMTQGQQNRICTTVGCVRQRLLEKSKCIDCEVDANLPGLYVEIEGITQKDT